MACPPSSGIPESQFNIVRGDTSASARCGPHNCLERIECLLSVSAAKDKPLPRLLPGTGDTSDVLLVNHSPPVNEEVALLEHNLEPRPDSIGDLRRDRRSDMFREQVVGVIEALEDTPAVAPHDRLVLGHARCELLTCEDLEKCHDLDDSICGSLVEDAFNPSLLTQVIGQGIFQCE